MIRPAEIKDRLAMVRMARSFVSEAALPFPCDAAWMERSFKAWIDDPDKLALVLDLRGVKGMLCAACTLSPLAPIKVAAEQVFWIDPAARGLAGAKWAKAMIADYEKWARAQNCQLIAMATVTEHRAGVLYERTGFTSFETHYMKAL